VARGGVQHLASGPGGPAVGGAGGVDVSVGARPGVARVVGRRRAGEFVDAGVGGVGVGRGPVGEDRISQRAASSSIAGASVGVGGDK
jgi:hypothetical protein